LEHSYSKAFITVSDLIEYLYCPRFIYYMHCLAIPQREERLTKVKKGRELHEAKKKTNLNYLRRRYGVQDKKVNVYLSSPKLGIRGFVDEVLFLEDGSVAPLDYKFAKYREELYRTHKYQSVVYGLMMEEAFNKSVKRGFIVYTRSANKLVLVDINEKNRREAHRIIREILNIIQSETYPEVKQNKNKCLDCTYRRLCVK